MSEELIVLLVVPAFKVYRHEEFSFVAALNITNPPTPTCVELVGKLIVTVGDVVSFTVIEILVSTVVVEFVVLTLILYTPGVEADALNQKCLKDKFITNAVSLYQLNNTEVFLKS